MCPSAHDAADETLEWTDNNTDSAFVSQRGNESDSDSVSDMCEAVVSAEVHDTHDQHTADAGCRLYTTQISSAQTIRVSK